MRKIIAVCLLACLIGCKGSKGNKGDSGNPGNANVRSYSGFITGNDQLVFVTGDPRTYAVSVSLGDGTNFTELPYFLPGSGINTFYAFRLNTVEIFNAQTAAATQYQIYLIQRNETAAVSGYRALLD